MGFKRTNDGRVFFQGADEPSNEGAAPQRKLDETPKSCPSQLQILSLLKSLNERLKSTQAERNYMRKQLEAYREVIEALEDKSEKNEQSFAKLEKALLAAGGKPGASSPSIQRTEALMKETLKEMGETRKLLIEIEDKAERANRNTGALQKMQQDQAQKMARSTASYAQMLKRLKETEEKQESIAVQLEDTIAQQAKMVRKIDKVAEDRARFMRKIERIEETVIQTRDALNAKAMVLLTDQGAEGAGPALDEDQTLGQALLQQQQKEIKEAPPVIAAEAEKTPRGQIYSQIALGGILLGAAAILGWTIAQINKTDSASITQNGALEEVASMQNAQPAQVEQSSGQNWSVETDTAAFAENTRAPVAATPVNPSLDALDDIGTLSVEDDQAILDLLEVNPDAVAAALNEIEPGTPNVEPIQQASVQPQEACSGISDRKDQWY